MLGHECNDVEERDLCGVIDHGPYACACGKEASKRVGLSGKVIGYEKRTQEGVGLSGSKQCKICAHGREDGMQSQTKRWAIDPREKTKLLRYGDGP